VPGGNNLKSDAARSNADSPFSRRSTLLGFSAAAMVVSVLGWLTQWRESFVMIYVGAGLASLWFFSRLFYGFRSASLIDKADTAPGSMGVGGRFAPIRWDGRQKENLSLAYEKWRVGDPSELERIATEEERQQHDD
jgi:hypothetical protein